MTEDQAKTKWCPFIQFATISGKGIAGVGTNRNEASSGDAELNTKCIGSACMAWRWVKTDTDYEFGTADNEGKMKVLQSPITKYGYCGLAGK